MIVVVIEPATPCLAPGRRAITSSTAARLLGVIAVDVATEAGVLAGVIGESRGEFTRVGGQFGAVHVGAGGEAVAREFEVGLPGGHGGRGVVDHAAVAVLLAPRCVCSHYR